MSGGDPQPPSGGADIEEFLKKLSSRLPHLADEVNERTARLIEEERKKKELDIGFVGKLIGDVDPAVRVAFIAVCIFSFLLLFIILVVSWVVFSTSTIPDLLDKITTGLISLITGAVGYIIGHRTPPSNRPQNPGRIPKSK